MAFSCSDAVQLICNKLNDPNREVYADASYYGDAYDTFWECVNDLLIEESYKTEDVHGLVNDLSVTIPASGVIDISDEAPDMLRVVGHYTDPEVYMNTFWDEANNIWSEDENLWNSGALNKVVKNVSFEFFNQMKGQNFLDSDTILTYRVGDLQKFYPASSASGRKVQIIYLKYPESASSANLLTTYSMAFVYKVIQLATNKIIKLRGVE